MPEKKTSAFSDLTWDDLREWAGSKIVSRGQSYQRGGSVHNLTKTGTDGLIASVHGTAHYTTLVEMKEGRLTSSCTCPYWATCKHAVAVLLEYLERLKRKEDIHQAKADDLRFAELEAEDEDWQDGEYEGWEDEDEEEEEGITHASRPPRTGASLRSYLKGHTKAELIGMLEELTEQHPEVGKALRDRRDLANGEPARLVRAVRSEIDALSSEPAWSNSWTGEANIPDYSGVRERLEALLSAGHADEVVSLGKKLMEAGKEQVEMSNDEGETATEIAECMVVVFQALPQSSMSPSEQMLWAIDAELSDDYGLCGETEVFWNKEQSREAWTVVADALARRLSETGSKKGREDFSYGYDRDRLNNRLIHALSQAGRDDEVIPLCEREAEATGSYVRLVDALMEVGRWEEAMQWARKGIEATSAALPGIASELRDRLRKLSEQEGDVLRVAAFRAEEFFEHPGLSGFQELEKAAEQAKVGPAVRAFAMHYLKTGKPGSKGKGMPQWPLPETGVASMERARQPESPMTPVLIDIAIAEKNPEEVLRWHDQAQEKGRGWAGYSEDRVAKAVAEAYPERALEIWKKLAEAQIAQVKPSAYEVAVGYLRKAHKVLERLGREKEWKACLAGIRETHRRKRRLLEILDRLDGRRIIDG